MYLLINSATDETVIGLVNDRGGFVDKIEWCGGRNQSEELLSKINQLLKINKLLLKDLLGIIIVIGPGSYTGLRVGIATANALGFALCKNILGITVDQLDHLRDHIQKFSSKSQNAVSPYYVNSPYITSPRNRQGEK